MKDENFLESRIKALNQINKSCLNEGTFLCLQMVLPILDISIEELEEAVNIGLVPAFEHMFVLKVDESYIHYPITESSVESWLAATFNQRKGDKTLLKSAGSLTIKAREIINLNKEAFQSISALLDFDCVAPVSKVLNLREILEQLKSYRPKVTIKYRILESQIVFNVYADGSALSTENIRVHRGGRLQRTRNGTVLKKLLKERGSTSKFELVEKIEKEIRDKKNVKEGDFYDDARRRLGKVVRDLNNSARSFEKLGFVNLSFAALRLIEDDDFFEGAKFMRESSGKKGRNRVIPQFISENHDRVQINYKIDEYHETNDQNFI